MDDFDSIKMDEHALISKIMDKLKHRKQKDVINENPLDSYKSIDLSDGLSEEGYGNDENSKTPFSS